MTATTAQPASAPRALPAPGKLFLLGLLLSVLSGVLLLLSFPPYGLWFLAWVAFVPYLFAQYRLMPSKWCSLAVALANLVWLGPFLASLFGTEGGIFFTLMGVWIAIFSFFTSNDRPFHERTGYRWLVLAGVAGFVGFEMVRATFIPLVATNAFIGYTQASQAWLIQPVSILSVYGLDLLILFANYALTMAVIAWFDRRFKPSLPARVAWAAARRWLVVVGSLLVVWVALSLALFLGQKSLPALRVAALRPNLPLPAFQDETNNAQARFDIIVSLAREAAGQGAQVLYTPEMVFNFDPQQEFTEEFRALAKETGAYIFITYSVVKEGEPWRNEAVLLSPQGEFSPVYGKNHAFGEPPTAVKGLFPVHDTPLGRLATLICHDANYTDVARKLAANEAQVIAAPLREFGGFGQQYWTNAVFRAVENRVGVVVTGVATVAAIINPDGTLAALDTDMAGSRLALVADVGLGRGHTLYTAVGDVLGWLALAAFVGFMVFQAMEGARAKKAAKGEAKKE